LQLNASRNSKLIFKKSFFSESSRRKKKKKKKKKETSIEKKMSFFEAEGKTHNFPALASRNYLPNLWLKWDRTDRNALKREDCNAAFNQLLRLMKADAAVAKRIAFTDLTSFDPETHMAVVDEFLQIGALAQSRQGAARSGRPHGVCLARLEERVASVRTLGLWLVARQDAR
jgi:hypothetical protein